MPAPQSSTMPPLLFSETGAIPLVDLLQRSPIQGDLSFVADRRSPDPLVGQAPLPDESRSPQEGLRAMSTILQMTLDILNDDELFAEL